MKESTVKVMTTMLLPLIVSAAFVTAAQANYFHNPYTNINYSVGSAPNPKPADVRDNRLPQVSDKSTWSSMKEAQDIQKYILNYRQTSANEMQDIQNYILNYKETQSVASASPSR